MMKIVSKCLIVKSFLGEWKPEVNIGLPASSKILSVQVQGASLVAWVEHNEQSDENPEPMMTVDFLVVSTGEKVPDNASYIGTAQLLDGQIILHVYVKKS